MGSEVVEEIVVPDDADVISAAIKKFVAAKREMVLLTGGMSVDPDDVTPLGISQTGAKVVSYGAPVLPGAMFMLAYLEGVPILGLPGCVMYFKTTILDLVLPRLLAGEKLTRADIIRLAAGGLCQNCPECRYPLCSFGRV
jgi:molybdopterin biosynthesis enzyme